MRVHGILGLWLSTQYLLVIGLKLANPEGFEPPKSYSLDGFGNRCITIMLRGLKLGVSAGVEPAEGNYPNG